jgi:hypothetical protein
MVTDANHAAPSAIDQSIIRLWSWFANNMSATSTDGPAIMGMANGTIKGSSPEANPVTPPGCGNIILDQSKK